MPRHTLYRIQWSSSAREYVVFRGGKLVVPRIEPGGQGWFAWLETISSFSFQCRSGEECTVRKEAVQRGGDYWYAYRRKGRRMVKRYLARSHDLTLARLEVVTAALNGSKASAGSSQLLLATKMHMPRLPVQHVARPRLLALLRQGVQGPLTLVSAPAGSGKTTLLAEWASTAEIPVGWISLEMADNDPLRFLSYFMAALAGLDGRIDAAMRGYQFTSTQDTERVLFNMLNDLTRLLQREVVVILDDYHVATETIHALLRFVLDHLPPHLHLVIGTRVDPPLSLAHLRARGWLSEVRAEELRFVPGEVEALVRAMGLALPDEATNLLEQHTEGWIAGVQLLALALRGQSDATAFLRAFRGTHRFLLDYVSEEVLAQQTGETQRFLLLTCILERMTGSLCDAVTELPGGQARLVELLRANLFVSALDETESWYRYHPLFANSLRIRLQKSEPALIPRLYQRASRWYEEHQSMEEACDYAFLAGDLSRAANLVAWLLPHMIEQGRFERLKHWLSQLPADLIAMSPQLYITMPWLNKNMPENAEQMLQRMEQYIQEQRRGVAASWEEPQSVLTLLRALTALSQNKLLRASTLAREALSGLASRKTDLSQLIARFLQIILSITYGARGDMEAAERILLDLSVVLPAEPPSLINMAAAFLLGELHKARGQLRRGGELYESLFQAFGAHLDLPPMPLLLMGFALMRRASLLYEWNRLPEATDGMQQVLEILPRAVRELIPNTVQRPFLAFGLWMQARIELAQGRSEAARYFLELVRNQPEIYGELSPGKGRTTVDVPTLAARLALVCGQMEEAEHWEKTCGISYNDAPVTLMESREVFAYLTLARVLIARGYSRGAETALSQALILLDHWRDCAVHLGFQGWWIEIQMLTALVLQAQGKTRQALMTLGPVLAQAEPEGYVRLFADEGVAMARLLAQIAPYTTASPGYIQRLQAAISSTTSLALPSHTRPEASQALIDPLSTRELEVLALLVAGASNQQIADQLVISLNTAKRHVKHILAKLAVTNRTQAVARARELCLL